MSRPWRANLWSKFEILTVLGAVFPHFCPDKREIWLGEWIAGPPCAKLHVFRETCRPYRAKKTIFGPLSKNNTGMAVLCAGLLVKIIIYIAPWRQQTQRRSKDRANSTDIPSMTLCLLACSGSPLRRLHVRRGAGLPPSATHSSVARSPVTARTWLAGLRTNRRSAAVINTQHCVLLISLHTHNTNVVAIRTTPSSKTYITFVAHQLTSDTSPQHASRGR